MVTRADHDVTAAGSVAASARELLLSPLDAILTEPTRFRIAAALVGLPASGRISFTALRYLLDLTDGNLGMHLRVLVEVGYASVQKEAHGRRPQSLYAATNQGRAAFDAHVAALEAIIAAAQPGE